MSDVRAGGAYVELLLRDKGFQDGLRKAGGGLKSFAKSAAVIAGPLLSAFGFTKLIQEASDFEEVMNKFNVVFGQNAANVKKWGDEFAKEVGRSKKQIAEFMGNTQDLFVPLGFEPGAATELSKQVTRLSLDLASFNNMQDADTIRDLHAALTGSGEVMKKYGVIVSEAAVKQELLNQGMDPKNATEQEKVQARLNIIMAGTSAAQGDAIRSAGGFANQMKALQSAISDTAVIIGSLMLPTVTQFVNFLQTSISAASEYIISTWTTVVDWWQTAQTHIMSITTFVWENFGTIIQMALTSAQLSVVTFGNQLIYLFTEAIPGYLSWFGENWYDVFTDVANMTKTVASNIWENLKNLWESIVGLFNGEGFNFEWTGLTEGFESAIKELPQIAEREIGGLEKSLQTELNGLADELNTSWEDHQKRLPKLKEAFVTGPTELAQPDQIGAPDTGAAAVAKAARAGGDAGDRVLGSFSAAALAAGASGGDPTTSEVKGLRDDQKKQHKELVKAVSEGGKLA